MKIETVAREDQQTQLIAELEPEILERYKRQAARKISQSRKIPGFRPGKAPYDLIRRMYGDEALNQEAIELMLDEVYPQVLKEANIEPSGPGKLEEIVSMDPPRFSFIVPLKPEVVLGDYTSIRKEYAPEPVTDEQVDQAIRRLQRSYATAEPVERPAQQGDLVSFKMSAKRVNPEEGEDETLVPETPYQMIAGEDEEAEGEVWPYAGFAQELIGVSAGETKVVNYTFDEESPYEDLRGKEAAFNIEVQNVKELHLPELNDEFAQSMGEFETLEDLRKAIRQQLEQNYQQQYDQNYYEELMEELVSMAEVKYPPHLLEEEIEEFIHGVQHNLERDRLDLDTYLKMREMDRETFIEQEVKPAAARRLERSLVLEEFARRENVEVKGDEIRSVYYAALQQMQQSTELRKMQSKNKQSPREMANSIAINTVNSIFNQRLLARLKAIATGKGDEPEAEMEEASEAISQAEAESEAPAAEAEAPVAAAEAEADTTAEQSAPAESEPAEAAGAEASATTGEEQAESGGQAEESSEKEA